MILPQLRSATASLHERVERAVDLSRRLQSLSAYTELLELYFGFYQPLERQLAEVAKVAPLGLDIEARWKAPLLRGDLLAIDRTSDAIERLRLCPTLPTSAGPDDAFGCLYVLEGATLGGQIVRKQIERDYGLVAGRGGSFFASYGEKVGPMWKEFCAAMEEYARQHPRSERRIVDAAVETFACFERWFSE